MKSYGPGMGAIIGIGAAFGILLMPLLGPMTLVVGAALGVVFGAAYETHRAAR
jgi:hypothetical protein